MTCSSLLMGFVKRTFKDSHARLVEKLVERAHILESSFANERLKALRNVDPGERMGHGDIFIAPPPDYLPPGYSSPAPTPRYVSHTRSNSDPVVSPGFSQSSTLYDGSNDFCSPKLHHDQHISFKFLLEEKPVSASAPEPSSFLAPAATYDGGFSQRHERPMSLYPGSLSNQFTERAISLMPLSPRHPKEENTLVVPPRISYTPDERPISFTFPFDPKSPFDRKYSTEDTQASQQNILDDIDDAIDEVFFYTLPSTTYQAPSAPTYEPVSAPSNMKRFSSHERKDSAFPQQMYCDTEVPPVPEKDDKYKRMPEIVA